MLVVSEKRSLKEWLDSLPPFPYKGYPDGHPVYVDSPKRHNKKTCGFCALKKRT